MCLNYFIIVCIFSFFPWEKFVRIIHGIFNRLALFMVYLLIVGQHYGPPLVEAMPVFPHPVE